MTSDLGQVLARIRTLALNRNICTVQLLLEEFGKYAAGRQAYFTNIYNQVSSWQPAVTMLAA